MRDGEYAPLDSYGDKLFGVPVKGAVFRTQPTALAPFVGGVISDYTIDCTMKQGELLLAPGPDQTDQYLTEKKADPKAAWAKLVNSLLESPRYGERWGRHWMDTVGYVDVRLYDGDATTVYPNEGMWRCRDYVIKSFNDDKPWDEFIQEQLAGD